MLGALCKRGKSKTAIKESTSMPGAFSKSKKRAPLYSIN